MYLNVDRTGGSDRRARRLDFASAYDITAGRGIARDCQGCAARSIDGERRRAQPAAHRRDGSTLRPRALRRARAASSKQLVPQIATIPARRMCRRLHGTRHGGPSQRVVVAPQHTYVFSCTGMCMFTGARFSLVSTSSRCTAAAVLMGSGCTTRTRPARRTTC